MNEKRITNPIIDDIYNKHNNLELLASYGLNYDVEKNNNNSQFPILTFIIYDDDDDGAELLGD